MFKYVSLSLSRGCLDYCNLRCPNFSPLISWTGFDYVCFFLGRFFNWRLACCQLFSCLVVKWVYPIEGCSSSISFVVLSSHFFFFFLFFLLFSYLINQDSLVLLLFSYLIN